MAVAHRTMRPQLCSASSCSEPEMPLLSLGSYWTAATMKKMPEIAKHDRAGGVADPAERLDAPSPCATAAPGAP